LLPEVAIRVSDNGNDQVTENSLGQVRRAFNDVKHLSMVKINIAVGALIRSNQFNTLCLPFSVFGCVRAWSAITRASMHDRTRIRTSGMTGSRRLGTCTDTKSAPVFHSLRAVVYIGVVKFPVLN
jgi:hypothetical protein